MRTSTCPQCGYVPPMLSTPGAMHARAVRAFVRTIVSDQPRRLTNAELHAGYTRWAEANRAPLLNRHQFGVALAQYDGVRPWRNGGQRGYILPAQTEGA